MDVISLYANVSDVICAKTITKQTNLIKDILLLQGKLLCYTELNLVSFIYDDNIIMYILHTWCHFL